MANLVQIESLGGYRKQELLSENSFISYCRKYGVDTDNRELNKLMEIGLLVPVIPQEGSNNGKRHTYTKIQFFLLKMLKSQLDLNFDVTPITVNRLMKAVEEYNQFLPFLYELFLLFISYKGEFSSRVENAIQIIKETDSKSRLSKSDINKTTDNMGVLYKPKIEKLLQKYDYNYGDLEKWRKIILGVGSTLLAISIQELEKYYHRNLNEEIIKKTFEPYQFIEPLNWVRFLFNGMKSHVNDGVNIFSDIKQCSYCLNYYVPKRSDNANCGSKNCMNIHGRELRKRWYKQQ